MSAKDGIQTVLFCVGLALILGVIWLAVQMESDYREACVARGGQPLIARGMQACVDPKSLR